MGFTTPEKPVEKSPLAILIVTTSLVGAGSGLGATWVSFPDVELITERAERRAVSECKVHTDREIARLNDTFEAIQLRAVNSAVSQSRDDIEDEITRFDSRLRRIEDKLDKILESRHRKK